jgi:hypothetical protein
LNTLFIVWVQAIEAGRQHAVERSVAQLLSRRASNPALGSVDLADEETALGIAIASLRHALRLHDRLRERKVELPDTEAFELARTFISGGKRPAARVRDGLRCLLSRHRIAKGDDAWLRDRTFGNLQVARDPGEGWTIPRLVRPHAYRMAAFNQIARDLGGI